MGGCTSVQDVVKDITKEDIKTMYRVLHFFEQFDTDKDGRVSLDELMNFMNAHGHMNDGHKDAAIKRFKKFDRTGKGTLSYAEFLQFMWEFPDWNEAFESEHISMEKIEWFVEAYTQFDENKDGKVDFSELKNALQRSLPKEQLAKIDLTREGVTKILKHHQTNYKPNLDDLTFGDFLFIFAYSHLGREEAKSLTRQARDSIKNKPAGAADVKDKDGKKKDGNLSEGSYAGYTGEYSVATDGGETTGEVTGDVSECSEASCSQLSDSEGSCTDGGKLSAYTSELESELERRKGKKAALEKREKDKKAATPLPAPTTKEGKKAAKLAEKARKEAERTAKEVEKAKTRADKAAQEAKQAEDRLAQA